MPDSAENELALQWEPKEKKNEVIFIFEQVFAY